MKNRYRIVCDWLEDGLWIEKSFLFGIIWLPLKKRLYGSNEHTVALFNSTKAAETYLETIHKSKKDYTVIHKIIWPKN